MSNFDPSKFVQVRLTVESLRHQVVHALTGIEGQVTEEIERQLDAEIKSFDFASLVKETLRVELRDMLRGHLTSAFSKLRYDAALRSGLINGIVNELRAGLAQEEIDALKDQLAAMRERR